MSTFKLEITQNAGTQFFKKNEKVFLEELAEKSIAAFRDAGALFATDAESNLDIDTHSKQQLFDAKMEELTVEFQSLCVLKKKNKIQSNIKNNLADNVYHRNLLKRIFGGFVSHVKEQKYLRDMGEYCDTYNRKQVASKVLKQWLKQTMEENRVSLKNGCLKKTDLELGKMQREYESLISNLENELAKKLMQLKREEEEHRALAEKYDNMVQKTDVQQA